MRIDKWIQLKRVKALCIALALVFGAEQVAWGMDPATFRLLLGSSEQSRQMEAARRAAVVTIYDDLYGRLPTADELKEALEFLNRSPQLAHLVERLAESPESRWRLRQLNPERIAARKAEAARISGAVSVMVGDFLRSLVSDTKLVPGQVSRLVSDTNRVQIAPELAVTPATPELTRLNEVEIQAFESWLKDAETLCSNCAPNALAPRLEMVGRPVSRELLTTQAFLLDYLTGNLQLRSGFWVLGSGQGPQPPAPSALHGPLYISMESVKRLAQAYGLTLNAVELTADELLALHFPMIAALDLTQDGEADHYVVVRDANEARVVYVESDGTREQLPTYEFLRLFTRMALVPSADSYGQLLSQQQTEAIRGGWDPGGIGGAIRDRTKKTIGAITDRSGKVGGGTLNLMRGTVGAFHHRFATFGGWRSTGGAFRHRFATLGGWKNTGLRLGRASIPTPLGGIAGRMASSALWRYGGSRVNLGSVGGAFAHRFGSLDGWRSTRNVLNPGEWPAQLQYVAARHPAAIVAIGLARGDKKFNPQHWSAGVAYGVTSWNPAGLATMAVVRNPNRFFTASGWKKNEEYMGRHWRAFAGGGMIAGGLVACPFTGGAGCVVALGGAEMIYSDVVSSNQNKSWARNPVSSWLVPNAAHPGKFNLTDGLTIGTSFIPVGGWAAKGGGAVVAHAAPKILLREGAERALVRVGTRELIASAGERGALKLGIRTLEREGVQQAATRGGTRLAVNAGERGAVQATTRGVERKFVARAMSRTVGQSVSKNGIVKGIGYGTAGEAVFLGGATLASGDRWSPGAWKQVGLNLSVVQLVKLDTPVFGRFAAVGNLLLMGLTTKALGVALNNVRLSGVGAPAGQQLLRVGGRVIPSQPVDSLGKRFLVNGLPAVVDDAGRGLNAAAVRNLEGKVVGRIITPGIRSAVLEATRSAGQVALIRTAAPLPGTVAWDAVAAWNTSQAYSPSDALHSFTGGVFRSGLTPAQRLNSYRNVLSTHYLTTGGVLLVTRGLSFFATKGWQKAPAFVDDAMKASKSMSLADRARAVPGWAGNYGKNIPKNIDEMFHDPSAYLTGAGHSAHFSTLLFSMPASLLGLGGSDGLAAGASKPQQYRVPALGKAMEFGQMYMGIAQQTMVTFNLPLGLFRLPKGTEIPIVNKAEKWIEGIRNPTARGIVNYGYEVGSEIVAQATKPVPGLGFASDYWTEAVFGNRRGGTLGHLAVPLTLAGALKQGREVGTTLGLAGANRNDFARAYADHFQLPLPAAARRTNPMAAARRAAPSVEVASIQRAVAAHATRMPATRAEALRQGRAVGLALGLSAAQRRTFAYNYATHIQGTSTLPRATATTASPMLTQVSQRAFSAIVRGSPAESQARTYPFTHDGTTDTLNLFAPATRQPQGRTVLLTVLQAARADFLTTQLRTQPTLATQLAPAISPQGIVSTRAVVGPTGPATAGTGPTVRNDFARMFSSQLQEHTILPRTAAGIPGRINWADPRFEGMIRDVMGQRFDYLNRIHSSSSPMTPSLTAAAPMKALTAGPARLLLSAGSHYVSIPSVNLDLPGSTGAAVRVPTAPQTPPTPSIAMRIAQGPQQPATIPGTTMVTFQLRGEFSHLARNGTVDVPVGMSSGLTVHAALQQLAPLSNRNFVVGIEHEGRVVPMPELGDLPLNQLVSRLPVNTPLVVIPLTVTPGGKMTTQTMSADTQGIAPTMPRLTSPTAPVSRTEPPQSVAPMMTPEPIMPQVIGPMAARSPPTGPTTTASTPLPVARVASPPSAVAAPVAPIPSQAPTTSPVLGPRIEIAEDHVMPVSLAAAPNRTSLLPLLDVTPATLSQPLRWTPVSNQPARFSALVPLRDGSTATLHFDATSGPHIDAVEVAGTIFRAPPMLLPATLPGNLTAAADVSLSWTPRTQAGVVTYTAPIRLADGRAATAIFNPVTGPAIEAVEVAGVTYHAAPIDVMPDALPAPFVQGANLTAPLRNISWTYNAANQHYETRVAIPHASQPVTLIFNPTTGPRIDTVIAANGMMYRQPLVAPQPIASATPGMPVRPAINVGLNEGRPYFDKQIASGVPLRIYGDASFNELDKVGLGPKHQVQFGQDHFYISDAFIDAGGRTAFLAYLLHRDSTTGQPVIFVNAYYKSNSQNVWRAASHHAGPWIGKGFGEAGQMLPMELQSTFEHIVASQRASQGVYEKPGRFFDVLGFDVQGPMVSMVVGGPNRVVIAELNHAGQTNPALANHHINFRPGYEPDFHRGVVEHFQADNPVYSKVTSYVILSANRQVQYLFNVDGAGRVWVGGVQGTSETLIRQGVRRDNLQYVVPEELLTPAFEYLKQMPTGYLEARNVHPRNLQYADASAFLNKISVIQEFRRHVLGQPGSVPSSVSTTVPLRTPGTSPAKTAPTPPSPPQPIAPPTPGTPIRAATPAGPIPTPKTVIASGQPAAMGIDLNRFKTPEAAIAAVETHLRGRFNNPQFTLNDVQRSAIQNVYGKVGTTTHGVRHLELASTGAGKTFIIDTVLPLLRTNDTTAPASRTEALRQGRAIANAVVIDVDFSGLSRNARKMFVEQFAQQHAGHLMNGQVKTFLMTNTDTNVADLAREVETMHGHNLGAIRVITEGPKAHEQLEAAMRDASVGVVVLAHKTYSGAVAVETSRVLQQAQSAGMAGAMAGSWLAHIGNGTYDEFDASVTIPATTISTGVTRLDPANPQHQHELQYWNRLAQRTEVLARNLAHDAVGTAAKQVLPKMISDLGPDGVRAISAVLAKTGGIVTGQQLHAAILMHTGRSISIDAGLADRAATEINQRVE
ncbi:MAG: cysteine peptidase family C39 domain-containing protein, partial [Candidatus Omnitrophota bacterium]|nr:cysteine peptidase family C39 domain-containing protein [Candidatus Omnitrophota bacterium]